ncbi:MAG: acetyl-CoA carboxylase carboxyltransferase subunit beta [Candidatus Wallbacteria bacterium]|nr:acetyl-CoA carboxylase carboxyltransferase subunit beta [Candidatus Wallbacteria bacterium]
MGWFTKTKESIVPSNLWTKCQKCEEAIYSKDLAKAAWVCSKCSYHFRIPVRDRIELLLDEKSWQELNAHIKTADPLKFEALTSYDERVKKAVLKTNANEAIATGLGAIEGFPVAVGIFNFDFMGGSMGSAVGEKIVRLTDEALRLRRPLLIVSCSGGARMDEGVLSLMQMVKTSQAIARLSRERLPFLSLLTDPTTGGVTASFAMLGDVILAEPGALIGFAGPRVIEQTIKETLPEGFQRAEFLLETGVIDMVVPRKDLRATLAKLLRFFSAPTHTPKFEAPSNGADPSAPF